MVDIIVPRFWQMILVKSAQTNPEMPKLAQPTMPFR